MVAVFIVRHGGPPTRKFGADMAFDFGAIAGPAASLLGSGLSFLGGSNALAANQAQNAFANQMAQQQFQFEEDAAKNGIQWRVADAKAAGVSPLVALGAPTFNPGGVSVGGGNQDNPYAGAGAGLVAMGQDLSRAAMVAQTEKTRSETMKAVADARNNSLLAQSEVEKNLAGAALARKQAEVMSGPRMPDAVPDRGGLQGQGNVTSVVDTPGVGNTRVDPNYQWRKVDETHWQKTPPPSLEASASIFNPEYLLWLARNRLFDQARHGAYSGPPMQDLPDGAVRWKSKGGGIWEATPYYDWERR